MLTTIGKLAVPRMNLVDTWKTDLVVAALGSLFIALSAQIAFRIAFSPVPITAQTLAVLTTAMLLGRRRGTMSVGMYLIEGLAGLPVFAGGGAGASWLLGPTGGYLAGFLLAAFFVGALAERGADHQHGKALLTLTFGHVIIYLTGAVWLSLFTGLNAALLSGVVPFLAGDVCKILLGALSLPPLVARLK